MNPVLCTTDELAREFGVTQQTISNWVNRVDGPMPKAGENKFDVLACYRWRIEQHGIELQRLRDGDGLTEAQTRNQIAQAETKELELARRREQVVSTEGVMREWSRVFGSVRTNLLGLPAKVAKRVQAAKNTAEIKSILESALHDILNDYTEHTGLEGSAAGGEEELGVAKVARDEDAEAPSSDDRKRVGRRKAVHSPRRKSGRTGKVADVKG